MYEWCPDDATLSLQSPRVYEGELASLAGFAVLRLLANDSESDGGGDGEWSGSQLVGRGLCRIYCETTCAVMFGA